MNLRPQCLFHVAALASGRLAVKLQLDRNPQLSVIVCICYSFKAPPSIRGADLKETLGLIVVGRFFFFRPVVISTSPAIAKLRQHHHRGARGAFQITIPVAPVRSPAAVIPAQPVPKVGRQPAPQLALKNELPRVHVHAVALPGDGNTTTAHALGDSPLEGFPASVGHAQLNIGGAFGRWNGTAGTVTVWSFPGSITDSDPSSFVTILASKCAATLVAPSSRASSTAGESWS